MENARTFLTATGCSLTSSGNQLHITYHGLVDQSLETNGYREFSRTFVASAVASVESWSTALPLALGSFQGSHAQNSLYPLVGTWHAQSGLLFLRFSAPSIPFPIYSGNLFSPVLPVKCSHRDIIDPILPQGAYLMMVPLNKALMPRRSRTLTKTLGSKLWQAIREAAVTLCWFGCIVWVMFA